MTSWTDYEPYLRGDMLPLDKMISVTIERVTVEKCHPKAGGAAVDTPILYFKGKKRGLPLSTVNIRKLRTMFGDEMEACIGKKIFIRAEQKSVAGRTLTPIYLHPVPTNTPTGDGEVVT